MVRNLPISKQSISEFHFSSFFLLYLSCEKPVVRGGVMLIHTVNSVKIALVQFLRFFAFSLERIIKIRND